MRGGLSGWDGNDWLLVALGGTVGMVWACASVVVGIQWWSGANLPR